MKITKTRLKKIIREEVGHALRESVGGELQTEMRMPKTSAQPTSGETVTWEALDIVQTVQNLLEDHSRTKEGEQVAGGGIWVHPENVYLLKKKMEELHSLITGLSFKFSPKSGF